MIQVPQYYVDLYSAQTKLLLQKLQRECNICKGQGYIIVDDTTFRDCECVKKFYLLRKYTQAGINVKHIGRDKEWFANEFTEETFAKLCEIENGLDEALKINFLIYPSTIHLWGASYIGNQIIKFCVDAGKRCAVASTKHMMDIFFAFNDTELTECREYLLQEVDVLLMDEFGGEYNHKMGENKSFIASTFNAFIMERKRMNKTTIIASNFPVNKVKESYASDIHAVISHNFVGLEIKSKSRRKSEFEGLELKLKPSLKKCFSDIAEDTQPTGFGKRIGKF